MSWKIRVTYPNGDEAWLRHGSRIGEGPLATFASRKLADINADFIKQGLDADCTVTIVKQRKVEASGPSTEKETGQ